MCGTVAREEAAKYRTKLSHGISMAYGREVAIYDRSVFRHRTTDRAPGTMCG